MSEWYYAGADRQQHGPLPASYIGDQVRAGAIGMETLVWRADMPEWRPLQEFADEFDLIPTAQPTLALAQDQAQPFVIPESGTAEYAPYAAPAAALSDDLVPVLGGEVVYAGFWKRVAASLLDSMVVQIIGSMISVVMMVIMVGVAAGSGARSEGVMLILQVIMYLISLALTAAYYAAFHSSRGMATLGKMAVGIKVVRSDGQRISLLRGVGRYFALMLSGLILCIGLVMAAFTQHKRALHDMICDTLVVDKWAFTNHPEWQKRELGAVTIAILVIFAVLLVVAILVMTAFFLAIIGSGL